MSGNHPVSDSLVSYALDELGPTEREETALHLARCKTCADVVSRLASALDAYRASTRGGAPAHILAELLEAQAAGGEAIATPWWRLRPTLTAVGMVGMAMLFLSGFLAGRVSAPTPETPRTPPQTRTMIPRPLPDPPVIDFQTEPPLAPHFVFASERQQAVQGRNNTSRDSL